MSIWPMCKEMPGSTYLENLANLFDKLNYRYDNELIWHIMSIMSMKVQYPPYAVPSRIIACYSYPASSVDEHYTYWVIVLTSSALNVSSMGLLLASIKKMYLQKSFLTFFLCVHKLVMHSSYQAYDLKQQKLMHCIKNNIYFCIYTKYLHHIHTHILCTIHTKSVHMHTIFPNRFTNSTFPSAKPTLLQSLQHWQCWYMYHN